MAFVKGDMKWRDAVNEDDIYRHTGMSLQFRPMQELVDRLPSISEPDTRWEMERWRKEAAARRADFGFWISD